MIFDLIVKNGRIIDGTGNPWYEADIGVVDGKIAAILSRGDTCDAKQVIDAADRVVSPGFIDTHSHDDALVLIDPQCEQKVLQGVTTEVIGNCGFSLAPLSDEHSDDFKAASAIMGGSHLDQDFWTLRKFNQYLEKLDAAKIGINVVPLVGHGTIRISVIGYENRPPRSSEMQQMKGMADEAMQAGAFGISSGLIYVPANYAQTEEVIELAKVVAQYGGIYATHMRSEGDLEIKAIQETVKIAKEACLPAHISHHKIAGRNNWGNSRLTLKAFEAAREEGLTVTWDQYPYKAGSTYVAAALPPHIQAQGAEYFAEKLKDPAVRTQIRNEIESDDDTAWENLIRGAGFDNIIISTAPRNPDFVGKSMDEIAQMTAKDPFDVFFDLIIEEKTEASMIIFMMGDEDIERIMKAHGTMIGSDGVPGFGSAKPHPRMTGTFPRILGRYVREKGVIALEDAIRKMTSLPAQTFQLHNKGLVRPGMDADLVVFNPATIIDKSTFEDPLQTPAGIGWVVVNGEVAAENGKIMGATSGKVLRLGKNG